MPEFILDHGDKESEVRFSDLPDIVQGFIEAMFFTETAASFYTIRNWRSRKTQEALSEGQADGTIPHDASFQHLHPDSLENIKRYCAAFEERAAELLQDAYSRDYDAAQAGRDLWFTSQGHGVGFWDRTPLDADGLGDKLSDLCRHQEAQVWFGDHVKHGNAPFVHVEL